jgi:hypothetical protein
VSPDDLSEFPEVDPLTLRMRAAELGDGELDAVIACADARSGVVAALDLPALASAWRHVSSVLWESRLERRKLYDEMDEASNPVKTFDLGEVPDDDDEVGYDDHE